ncbi:MAG: NAD(P)H-dependent oxidoreductase subunit E, partial [Bacteroidota bacterium]|nr:NAD(P)H-dependent oxidoreductase subunit E [Bacteroidota bacterium]
SKTYSIATFYNQFRFSPKGKYHITICNGTTCHISGASNILFELIKELNITSGKTTSDGLFSLEAVPCLGTCALAPVIKINDKFYEKLNPEDIKGIIESYRNREEI